MHRRIPAISAVIVSGAFACLTSDVAAQSTARPTLVSTRASATSAGRVQGIVRDEEGVAIDGASVLAMGETIASVRSDVLGRFSLALPPGDYILRATRAGYVSTTRVPVSIRTAARLERNITLTRQDGAVVATDLEDSHAHTELAWRLRHLTRSVLRDGDERRPGDAAPPDQFVAPAGSLFNRALSQSTRMAAAFFTDTDFDGQVNLVTTGFSTGMARWMPSDWPRGVAYVAVGAAVGEVGDWRVRGAIAPGPQASWVLVGQYESRKQADAAHAVRFGVSYGSQGVSLASNDLQWPVGTSYVRTVSGLYGDDHWTIAPAVSIDYGARLDRYDYVETPQLMSGHGRLRARVMPDTFLLAGASRRMVAPGADEFLPPPSGLWLPPERTFSALVPGGTLRAEEVDRADVGISREFSANGRPVSVEVHRFRETTDRQMVTLFGLDDTRGLGHYFVGSSGDVMVSGWTVGVDSRMGGRVDTHVAYTVADAAWVREDRTGGLGRFAPMTVRPVRERLHDFVASVDADLAATRLTLVFRTNSAFIQAPGGATGGRFNLQVHQALPYQPLGRGRLELVFAVRNLFRDGREPGAFYDELLTISPPLRVMAGVQVRF